jgi:predicted ABC-type ATPase
MCAMELPTVDAPELTGAPADPDRERLAERLAKAEKPGNLRDSMKAQLDDLPDGHPSAPREADGTPRPPPPRPADYELPALTDADYVAHVSDVIEGLDKACADGLTTDRLFTVNPDRDIWTDDRAEIHDQIIEAAYAAAADVPCEYKAVIAGGLGGAGKTTVLEHQAGIELSDYLMINPDTFKEELARRDMLPNIPGLSPLECSALAHEESSYLARQLAHRALADGKNVIWDITMSSRASAEGRIDELRSSGYQRIEGVFVDISVETSVSRMTDRHRRGHDRFLHGDGVGGRYIHAEIIRAQADPDYGSVNRRTFEAVKSRFDIWTVFDNSRYGHPAAIVDHSPNGPNLDRSGDDA